MVPFSCLAVWVEEPEAGNRRSPIPLSGSVIWESLPSPIPTTTELVLSFQDLLAGAHLQV